MPPCVFNLTLNVQGARGGANVGGVLGGLGGSAFGVLPVIPGDVLYIYVGGSNGYNGGGLAGVSTCTPAGAGCGGGATDIRLNGTGLSNRIIVGGGGGGAAGNRVMGCGRGNGGGGGGGYYGGGGGAGWPGGIGWTMCTGGTQTIGGIGGISVYTTSNGNSGTIGLGGNGGNEIWGNQAGSALGATGGVGGALIGGNGLYTGGGSSGGSSEGVNNYTGQSGAGGSSYYGSLLNGGTISGTNTGDGVAVISFMVGTGIPVPSNTVICSGGSVTLTAPTLLNYNWNTGSTSSSIAVSPTVSTSYTVNGTNALSCPQTNVFNVTVDGSGPSITILTTSATVCQSNTVALTALGASSYTWTGGIQNGVPFPINTTTSFTVSGSNSCGTTTASSIINVVSGPTLTASASSPSICAGSTVSLTAIGATSYTWSNGIPNGTGFTPAVTNTYIVSTTDGTCTASAAVSVTVFAAPAALPLASPPSICIGESSTLTATGATNYTWMPGGITSSTLPITPTSTSTYTLYQSNSNCVDIKTISVIVNSLPTVLAIASPTLICPMKTSTLNVAGASSYTWSYGNITGPTAIVSPTTTTTYTVNAFDGFCSTTATVALYVNPNPTISISTTSTTICPGNSITLTVSGGLNYTWTPSNITGTSVVLSPTISSVYFVNGDNSFGCAAGASQLILVNPSPNVTASSNTSLVCIGGAATLIAFGATTYSWNTGAQSSSIVVNPQGTITYTVTGYGALYNCSHSKTITVSVFTPSFSVTADTSVCIGGSIVLSASGANSYTWNNNYNFQNYTVSPTVATFYTVSAISSSNAINCVSTNTVLVGIAPSPTVTATSNKAVVCKGEKVTLTGHGATNYLWTGNLSGSSVQLFPAATQNVYTVTGTDAHGCVSTGTVLVKVSNCSAMEELNSNLFFKINVYPNPSNGAFTISSDLDIDLFIVNALGQKIRTLQLNKQNNWTLAVNDLAEGAYFIEGEMNQKKLQTKIIIVK